MSTLPKSRLTPEQYLEIERKAEFKSEYYQGEMFAMSGAKVAHILITTNALGHLFRQLEGKPYRVLNSDMRVCVAPNGLYTYPDLVVACGEFQFLDSTLDTLLNPTVIIEVLSESTEAYDRGQKFKLYRSLGSLAEYLLISSREVSTELFTRQPDDKWLLSTKSSLE